MNFRRFLKASLKRFGFDPVTPYDLTMSSLDIGIDTAVGNQIDGDYLEFGVYKGLSFSRAYKRFEIRKSLDERRFFAFDSFEGLPENQEAFKPAQYRAGAYAAPEADFIRNIRAQGVDTDKVQTIAGFYDQTLHEGTKKDNGLVRVCVAYIDCDLYESVVPVFDFLTNIIQTGTVLVIDDWFRHKGVPGAGIQKACDEWLVQNPSISLHLLHQWRRVAFVVNVDNDRD